jgi:hypothetical protein
VTEEAQPPPGTPGDPGLPRDPGEPPAAARPGAGPDDDEPSSGQLAVYPVSGGGQGPVPAPGPAGPPGPGPAGTPAPVGPPPAFAPHHLGHAQPAYPPPGPPAGWGPPAPLPVYASPAPAGHGAPPGPGYGGPPPGYGQHLPPPGYGAPPGYGLPAAPPGYGLPAPPPRDAWHRPSRVEPVPGTGFAVGYFAVPPTTSGMSVGALVVGIASILISFLVTFFGLVGARDGWGALVAGAFAVLASLMGLAAIGLGLAGLRQIRRAGPGAQVRGRGLAIAGLACGGVGLAITVLAFAGVLLIQMS